MAKRYSVAGRFCKSEASRYFDKILYLVAVVAIAGGFGAGFFAAKRWTLPGVIALVVTIVYMVFGTKLIDKAIEKLGKERVKYWRGGQVEELVSWILEELSDDWHIFNGLMLRGDSDIDHVLVGPGGVFVISTKSQRGIFTANDDRRIFCNLKPMGFINNVWDQAKQVKSRLEAFLVNDVPNVYPVLAVPFAWVECQCKRNDIWILHQENLLRAFQDCEQTLPKHEVKKLAKLFEKLLIEGREFYKPPPDPKRVLAAKSSDRAG
jgi:hypothetical protein